jgi:hypothetical protein
MQKCEGWKEKVNINHGGKWDKDYEERFAKEFYKFLNLKVKVLLV